MRKILFVFIWILTITPVAYSQSAKSIVGDWVGKTSQDYNITIKVEMVNGSPTVTELNYTITMRGSGYSATKSLNEPTKLSANISDGNFSASGYQFEISGSFKGDTLKGNMSATSVHPQNGDIAKANVTFTLIKSDSLKSSLQESTKPINGKWESSVFAFNLSEDGKEIASFGDDLKNGYSLIPTIYESGSLTWA